MINLRIEGGRIVFPPLHRGGQRQFVLSKKRFKVIRAGRRWGKTYGAAVLALQEMLRGGRVWWVAPSLRVTTEGWNYIYPAARMLQDALGKDRVRISRSIGDRAVRFLLEGYREGIIEFRSADSDNVDETLRGAGLDLLIVDEAAMIRDYVWDAVLQPALIDRKGRAVILSTPKGKNWFYRLVRYAESGADREWEAFHFSTYDNPHIQKKEIDRLRRTMSEYMFRQEILAEFVDTSGLVFQNVHECVGDYLEKPPVPGHSYVIGADWARTEDYTVFAVLDIDTGEFVKVVRMNVLSFADQIYELEGLVAEYRPYAVVSETNAMGAAITEELEQRGIPVVGFETTANTKRDAIGRLALAFERRLIRIPNDPVVIEELTGYTMHKTPSGRYVYVPPRGGHDDIVMAMALAYHLVGNPVDIEWI